MILVPLSQVLNCKLRGTGQALSTIRALLKQSLMLATKKVLVASPGPVKIIDSFSVVHTLAFRVLKL